MKESWPIDAIEVGIIFGAYNLKGWLKIAMHAQPNRSGNALFCARRWWLLKGCECKLVRVILAKPRGAAIVAQLDGCENRDAALALCGYRVYVSRREFPVLGVDEFYWIDLLGLEVISEAGEPLGKVAGMMDIGEHFVLRIDYLITGKNGQLATSERLIPFVGLYIKVVDQTAKRIIVNWHTDYET